MRAADMSHVTDKPVNARRLPEQSEWTIELIEQAHEEVRRVAANFGLDTYPNQLEIITAEQMMDAYASVGLPVSYNHWSFGKHFLPPGKGSRPAPLGPGRRSARGPALPRALGPARARSRRAGRSPCATRCSGPGYTGTTGG